MIFKLLAAYLILNSSVAAFTFNSQNKHAVPSSLLARSSSHMLHMAETPFEIQVNMPPSNSGVQARIKIPPVFKDQPSEIVLVRYKLPFGLNVEPQKGLAVCTKDGAGGEKVGDVLRYTSQWIMGVPRGDGVITTVASFAGGIGWQCNLFDVLKAAAWEEVVEALTSNVPTRTDEIVLIFERPLPKED